MHNRFNYKVFLSNEMLGLLLKFCAVLLSFMFTIFVTKNFNQITVGIIFQLQLLIMLGIQFSLLGYDLYLLEAVPRLKESKTNLFNYINRLYIKLIFPSLIGFILISFLFKEGYLFLLIFFITYFSYLKFRINISYLISESQINVSRFLENIVRPVLYVFFLYIFSISAYFNHIFIALSLLISVLLLFILSEFYFKKKSHSSKSNKNESYPKFFDTNIKYYAFIVSSGFLSQFPLIYFSYIDKTNWFAIFTVNLQIALLISFFQITTVDFVNKKISSTILTNKISKNNKIYLHKIKFINFIYTLSSSFFIFFFYEDIMRILFTVEYIDYSIFSLMVCIQIFSSFFSNGLSILAFTENQNILTKIFIISVVIQFILVIVFNDLSIYLFTIIFSCGIFISRFFSWLYVFNKFNYDSSVFSILNRKNYY